MCPGMGPEVAHEVIEAFLNGKVGLLHLEI